MKKEKTIRTYQRRTKSGKLVTVRQHTAKYDAAEKIKEMTKKKGAGGELEKRMKKGKYEVLGVDLSDMSDEDFKTFAGSYMDENDNPAPTTRTAFKKWAEKQDWGREGKALFKEGVAEFKKKGDAKGSSKKLERPVGSGTNGPTKKTEKTKAEAKSSEPSFTAAEFKEWYNGTGSAADKKVAKALRAQLGRAGYKKLEDEAIDNYTSRGHLSMFKRVSSGNTDTVSKTEGKKSSTSKAFNDAYDKVVAMGYRKTGDIKRGLASLGYDLEGRRIKPSGEKLVDKNAQAAKERKSSEASERDSSREGVNKAYEAAIKALKDGNSVRAAVSKYQKEYGYHKDHYGSDGFSSKHKELIKALKQKGYNEFGEKSKSGEKVGKDSKKSETKYRNQNQIPTNLARNVAKAEDFATVTEAKKYLQGLPDKEYASYRKSYGGPSDPSTILSGIRKGSRGIFGSDATRAKNFLKESSDYTAVKTSEGTLYVKKGGRSGYLAVRGGVGPSQIRLATSSELKGASKKS